MSNELIGIYEQLVMVSQRALENHAYEVAYHALVAAMHCADDLQDEQRLAFIEQEAERQKNFIDETSSNHRLSSQAVQQRGGVNLYDSLMAQAHIHHRQAKLKQHQQRLDR
ncbi:hypothetical protein H6F67_03490 [Microcoleus sp. FACHB-1515]|uniref:hypothetical protein n=1 Tax=Cyanophyceae TaxID=3028117 RepID=UPI001688B838|nr:hypothetical protein [Microcoleus sp. FACHB-1515]MBD2088914.1 hypothetical protein [Microcoleus sp. FACHB-1515]